MKLDDENQRTLLLNCLKSANLSGEFEMLMPLMTEIAELMQTVQSAEIETPVDPA